MKREFNNRTNSGTSKTVEKAIDILGCFSPSHPELGVTDISRRLGLDRATVYRLLTALERKRMVTRNPVTRRYTLGLRVRELAATELWRFELRNKALPYMLRMRDLTGETVTLGVLVSESEWVCVEKLESLHEVRQATPLGVPIPVGRGATGKLLLAYAVERWSEQDTLRLLSSLPPGFQPPDAAALLEELASIRRMGYAQSVGERVPDAAAMAVPVRDGSAQVVASLAVSGPAFRFNLEAMEKWRRHLLETGLNLSYDLGFSRSVNGGARQR